MIRCCNARCGVWQHSGCVDHIPDSAFFCASCAEQGGYGADPPPHKPVRLGATRSTHGDRAFVGITKPRNQTAWSNRMAVALAGDDVDAVDELLKRHPQPPSRGAMLSRAAVAGAAECVRGLIGKTPNIGVPVATKKEIGRAMHKALAAGHRRVVEAIRSALGTKLFIDTPNSNQHEHWPLGPGGYTHSRTPPRRTRRVIPGACGWRSRRWANRRAPGMNSTRFKRRRRLQPSRRRRPRRCTGAR